MIKSKEEAVNVRVLFRYVMTTADIDEGDDLRYTTYGVKALDEHENTVLEYADVSTNRSLVELVVEKCNHCQADAIHLEDVILDSIS